MLRCYSCKEEKTEESFTVCKSTKSGRSGECRACNKIRRDKNKEKIQLQALNHRKNNKEKTKERNRANYKKRKEAGYYERNKEDIENKRRERLKRPENRQKKLETERLYAKRPDVKEKRKTYARKKYQENPKHNCEKSLAWVQANKQNPKYKARCAARSALKHATKKQATPKWANMEAIKAIYAEAAWCSEVAGEPYHVDHIVPLVSKIVCGLHCEANLRVLQGAENMSKGNRFWPDMPTDV